MNKKLKIALICLGCLFVIGFGAVMIGGYLTDKDNARYEAAQTAAVDRVKNGYFDACPDITVGTLLGYYFGDPKYSASGEEDALLVLFSGVSIDDAGGQHKTYIFFELDGDAYKVSNWIQDDYVFTEAEMDKAVAVFDQVYRNRL